LSALWKPSDALSFRASLGTTFRGASPSQSDANSRVTVLSFVGPTGAFKATDWTGNPNLEPESAAITNLGVVWQPSESFQLTVDYWDIAFTDPVVIEDFNQLISYYQGQQAAAVAANPDGDGADGIAGTADDVDNSADRIAALEAALPDDIENQIICQGGVTCASSANSGSGIERIIVNWVNGASVDTSGLDIALRYSFDIGSGSMTLGATYNTIQSYDVGTYTKSGVQIAEGFDALGFLNQSRPALPLPELRSRYFLDFQSGDHTFVYYINVIGEYQDERLDNELTDGTIAANLGALLNEYAIIDEHITHDAHYNLGFGAGKGTFTASLINLTDEAPPGAALDLVYDPFTHNPIGRQIKLGIRYHVF
ncbi:MAG: TonB-dependent receptor domain-containing protein, partial [Gammaproteobacteria bacterium]